MITKTDFKRLKKPPKNYIPGLSRGDTGFITDLSKGPKTDQMHQQIQQSVDAQKKLINQRAKQNQEIQYSSKNFDKWNGYQDLVIQPSKLTSEDIKHQKELEKIEMNLQKKKKIKRTNKKKIKNNNYDDIFRNDKRKLMKIDKQQWENIPDVVPIEKRQITREKFTPNTDQVILMNINQQQFDFQQQNNESQNKIEMSNFEKQLYIQSLQKKPNKFDNVENLEKAKLLIQSLIQTNSKNPDAFLDQAKIELRQGNIQTANQILKKGINYNPKSESLWLMLFSICKQSEKFQLINKSLNFIRESISIWQEFINSKINQIDKIKAIQKALNYCPKSSKLWLQLANLQNDQIQKQKILQLALKHNQQDTKIIIELSKILPYKQSKKMINKINEEQNYNNLDIWIAAANLQEKNNQDYNQVSKILSKCFVLFKQKNNFSQEQWILKAQQEEQKKNFETCKAIIYQVSQYISQSTEQNLENKIFQISEKLFSKNYYYCVQNFLIFIQIEKLKKVNDFQFKFLEKLKDLNIIEYNKLLQYIDIIFQETQNYDCYIYAINITKYYYIKQKINNDKFKQLIIRYCNDLLKNNNYRKVKQKNQLLYVYDFLFFQIEDYEIAIDIIQEQDEYIVKLIQSYILLQKDIQSINKNIAQKQLSQKEQILCTKFNLQNENQQFGYKYLKCISLYKQIKQNEARLVLYKMINLNIDGELLYELLEYEQDIITQQNIISEYQKKYPNNLWINLKNLELKDDEWKQYSYKLMNQFENSTNLIFVIAHKFFKQQQFHKAKQWIENGLEIEWNNLDLIAYMIILQNYINENNEEFKEQYYNIIYAQGYYYNKIKDNFIKPNKNIKFEKQIRQNLLQTIQKKYFD